MSKDRTSIIVAMMLGSALLSYPEALLLGIVEGITEFLPISSTGHLVVVGDLIGFGGTSHQEAADAYSIAIQLGAILAVVAVYRVRMASMTRGIIGRDSIGRAVVLSLVTAFLPAAVIGFIFGDAIKDTLFGPIPIAVAWAVGGVLLLMWRPKGRGHEIHQLTASSALIIGVSQCIAMWPGVSRSLVTLLAGLAVGLSLPAAVEFSFLLGTITLAAATSLDLIRHGNEIVNQFGIARPVLGAVVAFVTAVIAVKWMVRYLATKSLAIFGWYRIIAAGLTATLLVAGVL